VKSILIIGNNGQVSQYLQKELEEDYRIHATSRQELDLLNTEQIQTSLESLIKDYSPSVIINPAAYTAVDLAEKEIELATKINVQAVAELGAFCAKKKLPLIHFSTDYVFNGDAQTPYLETDQPSPSGVYGQTKLDGERALISSKAPAIILRTAWVYSNQGKNFYNTMLNLAQTRSELSVVNDQYGAPTYAGSIAGGVKQLVDIIVQQGVIADGQQGVYHFTCQGQTTWCDFAQQIFQRNALNVEVTGIPSSEYPTASVFAIQLPDWRDALSDCVLETKRLAADA